MNNIPIFHFAGNGQSSPRLLNISQNQDKELAECKKIIKHQQMEIEFLNNSLRNSEETIHLLRELIIKMKNL
jgi:hypothetical protein